MAGDWIPISVDLPGKPEVAMLSRILGKSTDECLGMLIRFWIWCQAHTDDGNLPGMDTAMLTAVSHVPERFFGALQRVGWLEVTDSGCFIPNFERWFAGAAKRRLLEARKKRLQRANAGGERNGCPDLVPKLSRSCPDSVPHLSRAHRDTNGTRGEESRGEESRGEDTKSESNPSITSDLELVSTGVGEKNDSSARSQAIDAKPPPEDGVSSPPFLVFPTRGKVDAFSVTEQDVAEYERLYPGLDVRCELRKALAWIRASPDRMKTAKGMPRFIVNWLNRAVDNRSASQAPPNPLVSDLERRNLEATRLWLAQKEQQHAH